MSRGPIRRLWSRRPRRHVRRVASLEGKLPGQGRTRPDPNPQTPFVLSRTRRTTVRRIRTTFVVDLRSGESATPPAGDTGGDEELVEDTSD